MMVRTALFALGSATLLLGVHSPTPKADLTGYRGWTCVTPTPVAMDAIIALRCISSPKWDTNPANPHLHTVFKVYVNPVGAKTLTGKTKGLFPVGSIIVKEKFHPAKDSWKLPKGAQPVLLTAMIKREKGYDPANGDWEYRALSGDAKEESSVGLDKCAGCHSALKRRDYVFGDYTNGFIYGDGYIRGGFKETRVRGVKAGADPLTP